jgi:hypothetical protein
MKMWLYISKPFQITKVLEMLYMLDWLWYAVISTIPDRYVIGGIFTSLRTEWSKELIIIVLFIIAMVHVIALIRNVIWLRKFNLIFNAAILLYLSSTYLIGLPIPAGVGYMLILVGITIFAFLRMDESH